MCRKRNSSAFYGILLLAVLLSACGPREPEEPGWDLTGLVISINEERGTLLVDHDEIPGYMPRMVMEFRVAPGDLEVVEEGMTIRARMLLDDQGYRLERIWPVDPVSDRIVEEAARTLRRDTHTRGRAAYREIGENLPDFALYDQSGRVVEPRRFRGRPMVVNFIFSRCPDPYMCPAATVQMKQLQDRARELEIDDLELISITLDPEYDTPGVLAQYARNYGIDTSNFSFLTGPESAIQDLMRQLGVLAFPDDGLIQHTLATLLIDRDGRIIHRADGTRWEVDDFVTRLLP
ncbi:MAG: electron transporter SenC [Puniceicoccaceae bacterium]|nr:MAG: electron transporter SenC [Puniceicoccaceae bacterium]